MPEAVQTAPAPAALVKESERVIARGSLSFALAARLLGRAERDAIVMLYRWFRHCDDVIDAQQAGFAAEGHDAPSAEALAALRESTHRAVQGGDALDPVHVGLAHLCRQHGLPEVYLQDFLAGMAMDVDGAVYDGLSDLKLYCYRVAGTVGVIFAHIVGVSDEAALRHAAHLGIAMQLSNIARDVADDHRMGRVYLPRQWLEAFGLTQANLLSPEKRHDLVKVVRCLVATADQYYLSGDAGLKYLPFRAALAVAAARGIYSAIGHAVVARGPLAWDDRTVIPLRLKLWFVAKAFVIIAATLPARLRRRWQPAALSGTWRFI
jgi:phytoene synthase